MQAFCLFGEYLGLDESFLETHPYTFKPSYAMLNYRGFLNCVYWAISGNPFMPLQMGDFDMIAGRKRGDS